MESEYYNDRNKKRSRPVPLIVWFGGALLTGGLITFAVLNFKKGDLIDNMTLKFTETETALTKEKNELSDKLGQSNADYTALAVEHEAAIASLSAEKSKNNRLAASVSSYILRETKLKEELMFWQDSTAGLFSELVTARTESDALRATIENLQAQIQSGNNVTSDQAAEIQRQIDIRRADSLTLITLRDSIRSENVAGYFNNTNLTGAYGLKVREVPNSKYFFGLQTINGYVINRHFMTGIGVGIQSYNGGTLMAPVFVDLRLKMGRNKFQPYLFADGGVLLNFDDIETPSLFVNPGLGFMHRLGNHLDFNMGAGFYLQKEQNRHSFVNMNVGIVYRKK